jgi:hypothetical protein
LNEFEEVRSEFERIKQSASDPVVIGNLLYVIAEERASTNLLLREINAKLDKLISVSERREGAGGEVLLSDIDKEIVDFIGSGRVCASDVQERFKYKGSNAASSRLNRLCDLKVLRKFQVGRKVFFERI